jgi:hypothetical protein
MRNFLILLLLAAGLTLAICLNGGSQGTPGGSNSQMLAPESEQVNGDAAESPDTIADRVETGAELTSRVSQQPSPSGREVADETASVPAASDGSDALISCPGEVMPAFRSFRRMSAERKVEIAAEIRLTAREWEALRASVSRFEAELHEVELTRAVILFDLHEAKVAAGDYEHFPHPDGESDPERARQIRKAIANAMKPTSPRQSVLKSTGSGRRQLVTRCELEEDPRLGQIDQQIQERIDRLVASVTLELAHRL